jgi:hypothetical protein
MVLVALVSIMVVGMPASPAAGGGWWTFVTSRPSLVAPGMMVRIQESGVMLANSEVEAARRGEAFYAYLVEDFDRRRLDEAMTEADPGNWWRLEGAEPTRLSAVNVIVGNGNLARIRAKFRMPRTPADGYSLMICDAGCVRPLGSIIPAPLTVVRSPTVAQLEAASDRMRRRLGRAETATTRLRVRLQRSLDEVSSLRGAVSTMGGEVSYLEGRLRRAEEAPVSTWPLWISLGGACVALATLAYLWRKRARSADRSSHELTVEDLLTEASISPEELQRTRSR